MNQQNFNESYWQKTSQSFPVLKDNLEADVCVIGAGITGLTCAYLLLQQGKSVIILDKGTIAAGQTGRTSAHLCSAIDDRYYLLEKLFPGQTHLIAESHMAAIDKIEEISKKEKIDCDFSRVDGYLYLHEDHPLEVLEKEFEALKRIKMKVKWMKKGPFPSFETGPCIEFAHQGQFHPTKYIEGLTQAILKKKGQLFANTKVTEFSSDPLFVTTENGYKVHAKSIVVATNTPINDLLVIHTKQAAYRTYMFAGRIPKGSIPKVLAWDTGDPYHYIRILEGSNSDLLLLGGEDHKTGQPEDQDQFKRLEQWARNAFPMLQEIVNKWSGQVMEPVDAIAFIGRNPMDNPNVYIATGDSGNGLTHGTIAGILISDLILKKKNPWEKVYDPSRKTLRSINEFAKENANVAVQYTKWIVPNSSEVKLNPETGTVVQDGVKKDAVYQDKDGETHKFSAFCPHLGGPLQWNPIEKTWDCPCHGSRFDRYGKVINGPAKQDLTRLDQEEEEYGPSKTP